MVQNKTLKEAGLFILDIILNVAIIVFLVYVVRQFIVAPFQVFGPSMCNTLNYQNEECLKGYGEYIIVNKFGYLTGDIDRGDIVVFHPPGDPENFYIKRVIGLPNENLKVENGDVYVKKNEKDDWQKLNEDYLNEQNRGKTSTFTEGAREFKIPTDKYFVMGDNRRASTDSRSCFKDPFGGGCKGKEATPYIGKENVAGKAWLVLWPFNYIRVLDEAAYEIKDSQILAVK